MMQLVLIEAKGDVVKYSRYEGAKLAGAIESRSRLSDLNRRDVEHYRTHPREFCEKHGIA